MTPKSNSIWNTDRPMTRPPKARYWMNLMPGPSLGCVLADGAAALVLEEQRGERGEARAADQHQVGRPPQRDVLAEDAVPDVVEREPDQRVEPAAGHQDAADRGVPVPGDPDGGRARLVIRQHAGQAAGDEQDEQPEQDEVVRGVGQRPGVAALADVQADVPDEAEQRA